MNALELMGRHAQSRGGRIGRIGAVEHVDAKTVQTLHGAWDKPAGDMVRVDWSDGGQGWFRWPISILTFLEEE